MKRRRLFRLLRARLKTFPAVVLVGPRQCGKTTLAQSLTERYFDLEQPGERVRLDASWDAVVSSPELIVLDEAQSWPDLFPRLRGAIDAQRKRAGRFLLLGSVSPALMREVSESLAGRLSILELTPLQREELTAAEAKRHWRVGGFPEGGILTPRRFPQWQKDYLSLLVQRDLPSWGMPGRPSATDRLIRMLATLNGQLWNASQLAQSLGVSYHTVNSHLDFLEGAFLLRRLLPFHANLTKRLVKSPKVYLRDTGLLHALMGVQTERELLTQPWVGASFEGYCVEQILGALLTRGLSHQATFFRTSDGHEIDLVVDVGLQRWAIELKLTTQPALQDLNRLDENARLIGATHTALVCRQLTIQGTSHRMVTGLEGLLKALPTSPTA